MSDLPIEDDQGRVNGLSDTHSRRLDQLAEVGQQLPRGGRFTPGIGGRGAVGGLPSETGQVSCPAIKSAELK